MIFPEWRGVKLVATISQGTPWMLVMKVGLAKRGEIEAVKSRRIGLVQRALIRAEQGGE